jgi:hypothetical protein
MRCHLRYDNAGNVIETHEHAGDFKRPVARLRLSDLQLRQFTSRLLATGQQLSGLPRIPLQSQWPENIRALTLAFYTAPQA